MTINLDSLRIWLDLLSAFCGLGLIVWQSLLLKKFPRRWYLILPVLAWSIHLAIFYGVLTYARVADVAVLETDIQHFWSVVLRVHGILTIGFLTYIIRLVCVKAKSVTP